MKLPRLYPILDTAPVARPGLHVGQEDLPPAAAHRILGPHRVLGFSTHNAAPLASGDCQEVDYLAVGPSFATASKENPYPAVGLDELARLRKLSAKPLVAIGGITRANAPAGSCRISASCRQIIPARCRQALVSSIWRSLSPSFNN